MPTRICSIENCTRPHVAKSYCGKHYRRWHTHGDPHTNLPHNGGQKRAEIPTYEGMHLRLNRLDIGPAKNFPCVEGCGRPAAQWSYDHGCEDELVGAISKRPNAQYVYCPHLEHYSPRCKRCHYDLDKQHRRPDLRQPRPRTRVRCAVDGCDYVSRSHGYCPLHNKRFERHGDPLATLTIMQHDGCTVPGCNESYYAKNFCQKHYKRSYYLAHKAA